MRYELDTGLITVADDVRERLNQDEKFSYFAAEALCFFRELKCTMSDEKLKEILDKNNISEFNPYFKKTFAAYNYDKDDTTLMFITSHIDENTRTTHVMFGKE